LKPFTRCCNNWLAASEAGSPPAFSPPPATEPGHPAVRSSNNHLIFFPIRDKNTSLNFYDLHPKERSAMKKSSMVLLAFLASLAVAVLIGFQVRANGQQHKEPIGYQDTPMLPGGKWHVHDGMRPRPPVITPGTFSSQQTPGKPPSDAIILFDGKDLSKWQSDNGGPAGWKIENDYVQVVPGAGVIETKEKFGPIQLHLEWSEPTPPKSNSQGRGNSGVFLQGQYEIQVLDSYHNLTYADGQTGAVYGQHPPLVNACRPPGEWQTYDIAFTPAIWEGGEVHLPAYVTVFQNGVLVQNHTEIWGSTGHRIFPHYKPDVGSTGPLILQDHHDPVRYRNIWIREIKPVS
jgi:3-keto-disaccharide hydrolase